MRTIDGAAARLLTLIAITSAAVFLAGPHQRAVAITGPSGTIERVAGGTTHDIALYSPAAVATSAAGDVYVADDGDCRIVKVSGGTSDAIAGDGVCASTGDGVNALQAAINPRAVAVDAAGDVYVGGDCAVRRVDAGGVITTVAGQLPAGGILFGACPYSGEGGPASSATIGDVSDIVVAGGAIYIADGCQVHVVDALGIIRTLAGTVGCGSFNGDNIDATAANVDPESIAVDDSGNVYIADSVNCRIRLVSAGIISTVAGNGSCSGLPQDGSAATATNVVPKTVTVRGSELWFGEDCGVWSISGGTVSAVLAPGSNCDSRHFAIEAAPQPSSALILTRANRTTTPRICSLDSWDTATLVLTHIAGSAPCGNAGDGGVATDGSLDSVLGVAVATGGDTYIVSNCSVRRVHGGVLSTVDTGTDCPVAIAAAADGSVDYVDSASGCVSKIVGATASRAFADPATCLSQPESIATDRAGNVYVGSFRVCEVFKIDPLGNVSKIAGTGALAPFDCADHGDGGPATSADLGQPRAIFVDDTNSIYIATNSVVRKVSGTSISTVAGSGKFCSGLGDGGPATSACLSFPDIGEPVGLWVDHAGDMYIGDVGHCRVRRIVAGVINTVAGTGTCGATGDGGGAIDAQIAHSRGLAVDPDGTIYMADSANTVRSAFGLALDTDGDGYSDAHETALGRDANSYCAVMRADVDADGNITVLDISTVARFAFTTGGAAPLRYDQDGDGSISILDLSKIAALYLGTTAQCS